jgi:hypothetical protein
MASPNPGESTVIDSIAVSNTAGGTAAFATVSIQNHADSSVLWELDVSGGPPAAPQLSAILTALGGLYKGKKDIRFDIVVTMAGATALKVNVQSHEEVPSFA